MKTKYFGVVAAAFVLVGGTFISSAAIVEASLSSINTEYVFERKADPVPPASGKHLTVIFDAEESAESARPIVQKEGGSDQQQVLTATAAAQRTASVSFLGTTTPVITGSMKVTTAPSGNRAETWGGQTHLSVTDGQSTHVIGHNTTNFGKIVKMHVGTPITVIDSAGHKRVYHVVWYKNVTDQGFIAGTKTSVYSKIVNAHQGEQIVLQTCISTNINRVVWAR